jgi:hypothetical protein
LPAPFPVRQLFRLRFLGIGCSDILTALPALYCGKLDENSLNKNQKKAKIVLKKSIPKELSK